MLAAAWVAAQVCAQYAAQDQSKNWSVAEYGQALLQGLQEPITDPSTDPSTGAGKLPLLIILGDLCHTVVGYLHHCENAAPSLSLLNIQLLTGSHYVEKLPRSVPRLTLPGGV